MKKLLVVVVLLVACLGTSFAQTPMTISLGPTAGISLPMGNFSDIQGFGFFGGARAKFVGLVEPVNFAASVTYNNWAGKEIVAGVETEAANAIMVSAGAEYPFPMEGAKPYVAADVMYSSVTVKTTIPAIMFGSTVIRPASTVEATEGKFGFGFGGGVEVSGFDIYAKYQMIDGSDISALAAGVAYYFGL